MKQKPKNKPIIFVADGGIGKCIVATVPIRNLKKKYPERNIIVVTGHPEVFISNPNVHRIYRFGNSPYFFEDYIQGKKATLLKSEPYQHEDYIYGKRHIADVWCEGIGVRFDNPKPELYVSEAEKEKARRFLNLPDTDKNCKEGCEKPAQVGSPRIPLILQSSGGGIPQPNQPPPRMYIRDISPKLGKALTYKLKENHKIYHIRTQAQTSLPFADILNFPLRDIFAIIAVVDKFVLIDSFVQHACAAFGKKAVVLWGGTAPKVLGYDTAVNLTRSVCPTPFCHRPNSYFFDMSPTGAWECPHGEKCMGFEAGEIIKALGKK